MKKAATFKPTEEELGNFYEAFVNIDSKETAKLFLEDLLTPNELVSLCARFESALMFMDGMSYQDIHNKTHLSSATLAKISKCARKAKGYKSVLKDK